MVSPFEKVYTPEKKETQVYTFSEKAKKTRLGFETEEAENSRVDGNHIGDVRDDQNVMNRIGEGIRKLSAKQKTIYSAI